MEQTMNQARSIVNVVTGAIDNHGRPRRRHVVELDCSSAG
jgi:hypothetical protein